MQSWSKKRSSNYLAIGKLFENKLVLKRTLTSNIGDVMLDKVKGALDDLANVKQSKTDATQDSVNAADNSTMHQKKPKIDL